MVRMRYSDGLSLIELMVVIVILGILMAIAVPNVIDMIKSNRLTTETNNLMADFALARSEAATRGKRVTLCPTSDGIACATGAAWGGGRIIFVDAETTGSVDTDDTIVRYHQGRKRNDVTIRTYSYGLNNLPGISSSRMVDYLQFHPNGATTSNARGEFTFLICDDRIGNYGRFVSIHGTGRTVLRSTSAACSSK